MFRAASLAALSLLAAVVVACGGGSASGDADPATAVPADAWFYAEATVRPEGDLREDAEAALSKVMATDDPIGRIRELIQKAAAEEGTDFDYDRDVKPWLGERMGMWVGNRLDNEDNPGVAVIVAVTDTEAPLDLFRRAAEEEGRKLTKRSHEGVDYEVDDEGDAAGIVDDFLVVATEPEFKRTVDAQKGDSLADADRYRRGVDQLEDERLAHFYADVKRVFELVAQQAPNDQEVQQLRQLIPFEKLPPVAGAFMANGDRLALDVGVKGENLDQLGPLSAYWGSTGSPLVQQLPGDSWGAFGAADYGQSLKTLFDQYAGMFGGAAAKRQLRSQFGIDLDEDVLSWIGDVAAFVRGDTLESLDGGVVIQVTDQAKAARGFGKLVGLLQSAGGVRARPVNVRGAETAFAVSDPELPKPIVIARSAKLVVGTYGMDAAEAALNPGSKLGESEVYSKAKDTMGDFEPALLLSMPHVIKLVDASGAADASFEQARPYLEAYDVIAYGFKDEDDGGWFRLVAGLK